MYYIAVTKPDRRHIHVDVLRRRLKKQKMQQNRVHCDYINNDCL